MALTTLDPVTALIVIDLQQGIVGMPGTAHPTAEVVQRSAALAEAFRSRNLPVVLVNVVGAPRVRTDMNPSGAAVLGQNLATDWAALVPELGDHPADLRISKSARSALSNPELRDALRSVGATQLVLTGIATSSGVESTARQAFDEGYHLSLVTDAMTDSSVEAHEHSVTRIFPRIGETGTTAELLELLERRGE
ncbi:isochorismatase family protein [Psychromicrobium xiongbiense]|uniref:isochorismatase family protein n=1 Tax=Psychromicrobium xiongbiense TaxID=3051184 RepID=UPI002552421C|nr:isochorismatase family protein [Psychromicrobium sp. YIM S02556]